MLACGATRTRGPPARAVFSTHTRRANPARSERVGARPSRGFRPWQEPRREARPGRSGGPGNPSVSTRAGAGRAAGPSSAWNSRFFFDPGGPPGSRRPSGAPRSTVRRPRWGLVGLRDWLGRVWATRFQVRAGTRLATRPPGARPPSPRAWSNSRCPRGLRGATHTQASQFPCSRSPGPGRRGAGPPRPGAPRFPSPPGPGLPDSRWGLGNPLWAKRGPVTLADHWPEGERRAHQASRVLTPLAIVRAPPDELSLADGCPSTLEF